MGCDREGKDSRFSGRLCGCEVELPEASPPKRASSWLEPFALHAKSENAEEVLFVVCLPLSEERGVAQSS